MDYLELVSKKNLEVFINLPTNADMMQITPTMGKLSLILGFLKRSDIKYIIDQNEPEAGIRCTSSGDVLRFHDLRRIDTRIKDSSIYLSLSMVDGDEVVDFSISSFEAIFTIAPYKNGKIQILISHLRPQDMKNIIGQFKDRYVDYSYTSSYMSIINVTDCVIHS